MARTKGIDRPHMLTVLLSDEERDQLWALAAHAGLDVSSYVRTWIRTSAAETPITTTKGKRRMR